MIPSQQSPRRWNRLSVPFPIPALLLGVSACLLLWRQGVLSIEDHYSFTVRPSFDVFLCAVMEKVLTAEYRGRTPVHPR